MKTMSYINNKSTDSKQDLEFNVNGVKFTMKYVEGGLFMMGADEGPIDESVEAYDDEKPSHKVYLDSYYIGETQVTQDLWQAVMENNPSYWIGDKLPVETVSWEDCQKFIKKLNVITGKNFDLPTEAQWEFAARGGNKSRGYLYSGSDNLAEVAWYSSDQTHQVATKKSNELGLYDMSGNVCEWCKDWYYSDCYSAYYTYSAQDNPQGPRSGNYHVLRGSSWRDLGWHCRVSCRDFNFPDSRDSNVGLRLVLNPPSQDLEFNVNGVKFTMKYVEGGSFMMGALDNDDEAYNNEKPSHKVDLDSYYIGETQVTQDLWQAVMGNNPSYWEGEKLPVENISWDDCQEFIKKLNSITGKSFSLPTEAQWEFAARGGNKCRGYLYSGSDNIDEVAWYYDNGYLKTYPVAVKKNNELGLYDMTGNVWEWCKDWFDSDYYSNSPQDNPQGPGYCGNRVLRGGSWDDGAWCCRVSYRDYCTPDNRNGNAGLRLVLNIVQ